MATKGADIYDIPDAGMGGQFALLRVGADLYAATIAKGGSQGRLFVGKPFQLAPIDLGQLGITGALQVALDRGPTGTLVAYISRILDTDGEDRGRRVITAVDTGIAVGAQDGPVDPPAPPGGAVDLTPVIQAIAGARGPQDGKDADFNSVAGVHNGVDALYARLGIGAGEQTLARRLEALANLTEPTEAINELLFRPPTRDYGLPHELEPFVGTDFQQYLCATLFAFLEFTLRLGEFPKADGTTILRG